MGNDWKRSPVGISTALFETDVLETTDKLPVTVRHSHDHSGPNYPALPRPARPQVTVRSGQTDTCYLATFSPRPL